MPRTATTNPENTLNTIRTALGGLPPETLGQVFAALRNEQARDLSGKLDAAWADLETLCETYRSVQGRPAPVPPGLGNAFGVTVEVDQESAAHEPKGRNWYINRVFNIARMFRGRGVTEQVLGALVAAFGGSAAIALRDVLPELEEQGHAFHDEDGNWFLNTDKPDAWYTHALVSFLGSRPADDLATTASVNEHIIDLGGHGADAVSKQLPRLVREGLVREVDDGVWDVTNRRSDTWYDFTLTRFISGRPANDLPTTAQINEFIIREGGHGAHAVFDALPRLVKAGHVVEVDDGVWDVTVRRSDAWYDHQIINFVDSFPGGSGEDALPTTRQINEFIIAQGGEGAKAVSVAVPRLIANGQLIEVDDGVFDTAHRRSETWYDHTLISFIGGQPENDLATTKMVNEFIIREGGHGAHAVSVALPRLVADGMVTETDDGVWDVTTRRSDAWYDQAILDIIEENEGSATTAQVNEGVIDRGGQGAYAVKFGLPRLRTAGMVREGEIGSWEACDNAPAPWVDRRVFEAIRDAEGDIGFGDLTARVQSFDDQLSGDDVLASAERLVHAGLIADDADGEVFRLPQTRAKASAQPRRRARRRVA